MGHIIVATLRVQRLADFDHRAAFNLEGVYKHRRFGWRYIPIHPFSDEPNLLSKLGVRPDACRSVDAWCELNGDTTLVQSKVLTISNMSGPGLYAQQTETDLRWTYLTAVLDDSVVTRSAFEDALTAFVNLGFPDDLRFRGLGTSLAKIDGPAA